MNNVFNYGEALERLKAGKKVSCIRWNNRRVYIKAEYPVLERTEPVSVAMLILTDESRNQTTPFTPSVENQLTDLWYEV